MDAPNGRRILVDASLQPGVLALSRDGRIIWRGPVNSPIEDADCDTIILSPGDCTQMMEPSRRRL